MTSVIQTTRKQRRALEAENRAQPIALRQVPRSEWAHIKGEVSERIEVWRSRDFLVQVFAEKNGLERLSVCRTRLVGEKWVDQISWDEIQRLKRECGRGDRDAVEVFPADNDIVNEANMRHLWVTTEELPFKWKRER